MSRSPRPVLLAALALTASSIFVGTAPAWATARSTDRVASAESALPPSGIRPDFNSDGYSDLAIGAPGETLGVAAQGAVNVIYGSATGPTAHGNQLWSQDSKAVLGTGEADDHFGAAIGWGDFNGDGFDDMAVGVPGDTIGHKDDAGGVNVLYGSATGLTATGNQLWSQASADIFGDPHNGDFFGNALVGSDFDGDGYEDLVIGAVGDGGNGLKAHTGSAQILYGSAAGLSTDRNERLFQLKGKPEVKDAFATALAAGDFDNDGYSDLAIGVPREKIDDLAYVGAVNIMYGSPTGLTEDGYQFWHQGQSGVVGDPEPGEYLGSSLSVADIDADDHADLAIGIGWDNVGTTDGAGSALVMYGSDAGVTASGSELWNQDSQGMADVAEDQDNASDVLLGDFDGDGFADLAIGYRQETILGVTQAGAVIPLYGSASGLNPTGAIFYQDGGLEETGSAYDWFGTALSGGDYDGDGFLDLAIGVPGESVTRTGHGGALNLVFGSATGLTIDGDQLWHQDSAEILDSSEDDDLFGQALAEG